VLVRQPRIPTALLHELTNAAWPVPHESENAQERHFQLRLAEAREPDRHAEETVHVPPAQADLQNLLP